MGINRAPIKFLTFGFLAPPSNVYMRLSTFFGQKYHDICSGLNLVQHHRVLHQKDFGIWDCFGLPLFSLAPETCSLKLKVMFCSTLLVILSCESPFRTLLELISICGTCVYWDMWPHSGFLDMDTVMSAPWLLRSNFFFDRVLTNALDIYLLHIPSDFALSHYIHYILYK